MKRRCLNVVLAAVLSAAMLCGCADREPKSVPLFTDTSSSSQPAQPAKPAQPVQSSSSSSSSSTTKPVSTDSSTTTSTTSSTSSTTTTTSTTTSTSTTSSDSYTSSTTVSQSEDEPIAVAVERGSILDNYRSKWSYSQLTSRQKKIYIKLYNAAKNFEENIDVSSTRVNYDDVYIAYWAFDYDNPQFLELGSGYRYSYIEEDGEKIVKSVMIDYGREPDEISQSEFESITREVLAEALTEPGDYEKLKYVHDWIVNNTVYIKDNADYETEADGPVIYGTAICEGYAKAFMYFAQSMGFDCTCVIGYAGSVPHMWNMVKLDGQWYHVDVTWDDPVRSDGKQVLRDTYFLISDEQIEADHTVDMPFAIPSAPESYTH